MWGIVGSPFDRQFSVQTWFLPPKPRAKTADVLPEPLGLVRLFSHPGIVSTRAECHDFVIQRVPRNIARTKWVWGNIWVIYG